MTETLLPRSLHSTAAVYGHGLLLFGPLVVLLLAEPLVLVGLTLVGEVPRLATGRTSGFPVASALVLLGTILAALQSVHALVVFAGIAGIGLAAVMAYLVGPLSLPSGSGRAGLGVALALLATLSFTLVLARE